MLKQKNLPNKILCLITDTKIKNQEETLNIIENSVSNGFNMIQLREKHMSSLDLLNFGRKIKKIINNRALFIINDRVDIAIALKSDGIHFGENSIPIELVKNLIGKNFLIGKSIHQVNSSLIEYDSIINYWILGSIYKTLSHPNSKPIGLSPILELKKISKTPIIGIGGIDDKNSKNVIKKGCSGVAVKRFILESQKINEDTKLILESIA